MCLYNNTTFSPAELTLDVSTTLTHVGLVSPANINQCLRNGPCELRKLASVVLDLFRSRVSARVGSDKENTNIFHILLSFQLKYAILGTEI